VGAPLDLATSVVSKKVLVVEGVEGGNALYVSLDALVLELNVLLRTVEIAWMRRQRVVLAVDVAFASIRLLSCFRDSGHLIVRILMFARYISRYRYC
jgi:hypothetical protein